MNEHGDYTFNEIIKKDTYRKFAIVLVSDCGLYDLKEIKTVLFCCENNKQPYQMDISQFLNKSESKIEISFGNMNMPQGKNFCEFCFYDNDNQLFAVTNTFSLYLK